VLAAVGGLQLGYKCAVCRAAVVRRRDVQTNKRRCLSAVECERIVLECVMKDHSNNPSWSGSLVPDQHSQFLRIMAMNKGLWLGVMTSGS